MAIYKTYYIYGIEIVIPIYRPVHFLSTYKLWKVHVKRWVKEKKQLSVIQNMTAQLIVKHYARGMKNTDL